MIFLWVLRNWHLGNFFFNFYSSMAEISRVILNRIIILVISMRSNSYATLFLLFVPFRLNANCSLFAISHGLALLTLTAILDKLRPQQRNINFCPYPSRYQLVALYTGLTLATLGSASTQFTWVIMEANQFGLITRKTSQGSSTGPLWPSTLPQWSMPQSPLTFKTKWAGV